MARTPRWTRKPTVDGVLVVELSSWKYFHDWVRQEMLDFEHYIWRGQRDAQWPLESTLDRQLRGLLIDEKEAQAEEHLLNFQMAARGRRGPNPVRIDEEDEWWALGQHHGLTTPLLDWTESPFVALYFAFEKAERPVDGLRSVWAIGDLAPENAAIRRAHTGSGTPPTLERVRPHGDENARLVAQAGLFTRGPLGSTVDEWVRTNFRGTSDMAPLIKFTFPEKGRFDCLRTLNRMNINHLSLFPDLHGSSEHCNKRLQISHYG